MLIGFNHLTLAKPGKGHFAPKWKAVAISEWEIVEIQ
jgi:hypothetical protein